MELNDDVLRERAWISTQPVILCHKSCSYMYIITFTANFTRHHNHYLDYDFLRQSSGSLAGGNGQTLSYYGCLHSPLAPMLWWLWLLFWIRRYFCSLDASCEIEDMFFSSSLLVSSSGCVLLCNAAAEVPLQNDTLRQRQLYFWWFWRGEASKKWSSKVKRTISLDEIFGFLTEVQMSGNEFFLIRVRSSLWSATRTAAKMGWE